MADKNGILMVSMGLGKGRPSPGSGSSGGGGSPFGRSDSSMPPSSDDQSQPANNSGGGMNQKASEQDAGFIPTGQICGACTNFNLQSGDCNKVDGPKKASDSCVQYFEPAGGGMSLTGEPDLDDMGGGGSMSGSGLGGYGGGDSFSASR